MRRGLWQQWHASSPQPFGGGDCGGTYAEINANNVKFKELSDEEGLTVLLCDRRLTAGLEPGVIASDFLLSESQEP
jgi:hypothetical protein